MLTWFTEVAQYESIPLILKWIYMSVCFGKAPTSSCEVPCVSVLCFPHSQAGDAGRETENGAQSLRNCLWVAVLVKFASSFLFYYFFYQRFIVVLANAPPRTLILRHRNTLHVSRPVSQNFSYQFLGFPNGLLPYGPDQNCVWTLYATPISSFLGTHRTIK